MTSSPIAPVLLRPSEAAAALGISRAGLYNLLARGTIRSVKLGSSRRIPVSELERLAAVADPSPTRATVGGR